MTARLHVSTAGSVPCTIDAPIHLRATGFPRSATVRLTATMDTDDDQRWTSWADFTADDDGTIDPARAAATAGTYSGVDGMGLFWSMCPQPPAGRRPARFQIRTFAELHITLTAMCRGGPSVGAEIVRTILPPAVTCERLDDPDGDGVAGMMFTPPGPGPHPVSVVLAGSSGGISAAHAALLAGHGLVTLALSYFGTGALPRALARVPLEFWDRATSWLARRPECDLGRLALVGSSKGAELALLLASLHPTDIAAVVGYAPSGVVYQGIPRFDDGDRSHPTPMSSWTRDGNPLPFVPFAATAEGGNGPRVGPSATHPMSMREMHEQPLAIIGIDHPAVIATEKIAGPVLLISGTADAIWPAARLADLVVERAARAGGAQRVMHLRYHGAGHLIGIPHVPTFGLDTFGGTPQADAAAGADSWPHAVAFLRRSLRMNVSVDGTSLESHAANGREHQHRGE